MSVANMASLASIQGSQVSIATTKLEIFAIDMLWESCLKFDFEQLSHSMSVANIAHLASLASLASFPSNY